MPSLEWNKCWGKQNFFIHELYGYEWGNPLDPNDKNAPGDLSIIKKEFIDSFIDENTIVLEIGPGGGRWTQFFLFCKKVYLIELNPIFFNYINLKFSNSLNKFEFIETNGKDIPKVQDSSVDFIFSFGCFVHLEENIISSYFKEIRRTLKRDGIACIQYSDKNKAKVDCFSKMSQKKMIDIIKENNMNIIKHDTTTLIHSNVISVKK